MSQIIHFVWDAVKAADVEDEVKLSADVFHTRRVVGEEFRLDISLFDFSFCHLDGAGSEVKTRDLPARFGEGDDVGACAAADVEGATCGVRLDELEDFGRGDAAVPGWGAKVEQVELQAAEKIHLLIMCYLSFDFAQDEVRAERSRSAAG